MQKMWTTLEVRKAVAMRQAGHKIATVARQLGRTYAGVSRKLCKIRAVEPRAKRKGGSLERAIRQIAGPGVSDREIARRLNISKELVWRTRKRLGVAAGVSSKDGWRYRAKTPRRKKIVVVCWYCSAKSRPCVRGQSLKDQGWWNKRGPGGCESYCKTCVERWGSPDQWLKGFGR